MVGASPGAGGRHAAMLPGNRVGEDAGVIDAVFEHAPVGLCAFDREGRWIRANPSLAPLMGLGVGGLLGRTPADIYGHLAGPAMEAIARVAEQGTLERLTMSGVVAGEQRTFDVVWFPLPDAVGVAS